jgi:hypothetical protein
VCETDRVQILHGRNELYENLTSDALRQATMEVDTVE